MSTRTEQKQRLQGERRARERATGAQEQRRRRLWVLGASAVAALAVVGVLIVVSQGGGGNSGGGGLGAGHGLTGTAEVRQLFQGIPQQGTALGNPRAPVRMVEFVDLQCPFCARYTRDVLPDLVGRYVRPGRLQLELRPLTFIGPDSKTAAAALAAAAKQNRAWQFADLFYLNQGTENSGYITPEFIRTLARAAGASPGPIVAAAQQGGTDPLLVRADQEASQFGINSTPSFLIGRRGGPLQPLQVSSLDPSEFRARIDSVLKQ